jgi:hypothetical protein
MLIQNVKELNRQEQYSISNEDYLAHIKKRMLQECIDNIEAYIPAYYADGGLGYGRINIKFHILTDDELKGLLDEARETVKLGD